MAKGDMSGNKSTGSAGSLAGINSGSQMLGAFNNFKPNQGGTPYGPQAPPGMDNKNVGMMQNQMPMNPYMPAMDESRSIANPAPMVQGNMMSMEQQQNPYMDIGALLQMLSGSSRRMM